MKSGDEHMGDFVYCRQHLSVHITGWCTVSPEDKIAIVAATLDEAEGIARSRGWRLYIGNGQYSGEIDP